MSGDFARAPEGRYPGCRRRQIVDIERRAGFIGAFLKLECGHRQWWAGERTDSQLRAIGDRPCLEFPCYQWVNAMGKDC